MKTTFIYKALAFAVMAVGTSSCVNDWLDQEPSTGVDAGSAVTTTADLESVRAGMYAALKGNSDRDTAIPRDQECHRSRAS